VEYGRVTANYNALEERYSALLASYIVARDYYIGSEADYDPLRARYITPLAIPIEPSTNSKKH
jgi:hypothetical protein